MMADFTDDCFAPMVQDENRHKVSVGSSSRDHKNDDERRRSRRSSSDAPSRSASGRSCDNSRRARKGLDGQLETIPSNSVAIGSRRSGEQSVASSGTSSSGERPRRGRRASIAGGINSARLGKTRSTSPEKESFRKALSNKVDYGYGESDDDMGYGDGAPTNTVEAEKPTRSRRQRRCSIAEVVSSAPESSSELSTGDSIPALEKPRLATTSGIANIAIPMATPEEPKKPRGRRGSMLGAISRNRSIDKMEAPSDPTKKAGTDRDRRRQGTLMDRVGASDRRNGHK